MIIFPGIVNGILSTIVTLRIGLPIIRCPPDEASQLVAQKLHEKLHALYTGGGQDLFAATLAGEPRPLLALLDRDLDLGTCLAHTWTYQSMCHDVLGMKLNKLSITENEDSAEKAAKKTYDIDVGRFFFRQMLNICSTTQMNETDGHFLRLVWQP